MRRWSALLVVAGLVFALTPAVADPEQCREATATYNLMVGAIHAAVRDYTRCLAASSGRDDCGAEFIELQVTHRELEAGIAEWQTKCREERRP
jgi:hypothetical protein